MLTRRQAVTGMCVSRLGPQPAGSLPVNLETHTTDSLAPSAVCYCVLALVTRQIYQVGTVLKSQRVM